MELELKKLLKQAKDESTEEKGSRKRERTCSAYNSTKGRPAKGNDHSVKEWIGDAKATCESKG